MAEVVELTEFRIAADVTLSLYQAERIARLLEDGGDPDGLRYAVGLRDAVATIDWGAGRN